MISLGTGGYNNSVASDAMIIALKLGVTSVDTALDYGNQRGLAPVLASSAVRRQDIFVLSKVPGCGDSLVPSQTAEGCYNDTAKALKLSLSQLWAPSVDAESYVDAMLLHFPPVGKVSGCSTETSCSLVRAQWQALENFYTAGGARSIGVSNYCVSCLECLRPVAKIQPQINQIQLHAGMGPGPTKTLLKYCNQHGIMPQAYAPLGGSSSVHPNNPYPLITSEKLAVIGEKSNKSAVQIALRWVLQQNLPLATKSDRADYLAEDIDVFNFKISDEDMATLTNDPIDPDDPTRNACE